MIPYATLEDATTALGRNLTWFETFWFNYLATKSDFYIYCHTILLLILVYSLAPLPMVFVELSRLFDRYKIQPKVKNSVSDMFRCYIQVIKTFVLVVSTLQLIFYPAIKMIGIRSGLPLPSLMEITAQILVYLLIEDFSGYWIHRLLHSKLGYDNIHHVHHKNTAPMGYAVLYTHWAEIILIEIPTILGPTIAPGHILTFGFWLALRLIEAIETHSGLFIIADNRWNPTSNRDQQYNEYDFRVLTRYIPFYGGAKYHDYHHFVGGQSHCNFATLFTYCDYIYGTDKGYQIHKKLLQEEKSVATRRRIKRVIK